MNGDLQLRLKPFTAVNRTETLFFNSLVQRLSFEALDMAAFGTQLYAANIELTLEEIENGEDDTGYVEYNEDINTFEIHLDRRMPFGMVVDYLIHELAHVGSWSEYEDDDHGPEFGKAYAMLYGVYLEIYENFWEAQP